jgi:23S rRNA (uridine2552-2'-O)-methyltransferase
MGRLDSGEAGGEELSKAGIDTAVQMKVIRVTAFLPVIVWLSRRTPISLATDSESPFWRIDTVGFRACARERRERRWLAVISSICVTFQDPYFTKAAMKRTRTNKAWMREHVTDSYVQRARAEGYRSRAAYKLIEIDDRDRLIHPGDTVLDLGAAPGGWSQVAARRMKGKGRVLALDLLEMDGLAGVEFIQGDFREERILDRLEKMLSGECAGLVLSDMAPNLSGVPLSDQARVMHLAELGLDFCRRWLKPEGAFLVKVFQGHGYGDFVREMKSVFGSVATRKPEASRGRSAEVYLLGKDLRRGEG